MKFYDIDPAVLEQVKKGEQAVRLRLEIDRDGLGNFETVLENDIIEANFYGLKEATGGTTARGDVVLDNSSGLYGGGESGQGAGREVRVSFTIGEGLPYFQRFILYVDDNGFQDIQGAGRKKRVQWGLRDRSGKLLRTDESRDWTQPAVFTYSVVCDKTQPEKSLVHLIAKRAGLHPADIDCATIPVTLPYIRLSKNIWHELSDLAKTYRAHLECAPEKPLVFAHSVYQSEAEIADDCSYTFTGSDIFYLRKTERAGQYRNTVRLKINLPVVLAKQEIWRYEDPPVMYDSALFPVYPFRLTADRDIEHFDYEALYTVKDSKGTERRVIFADQIDTIEEAEDRLEFEGGKFGYNEYDITTYHDKALIMLTADNDSDLYKAAIFGRPIVFDFNRSCFMRDSAAIAQFGTSALNVTGSYFSEDNFNGRPQYEDWTARELAERLIPKREITIMTHRAVFHGRIGAQVEIETKAETLKGNINALSLRYKRNAAFKATFHITEA
jgi:hypothetical protein